MHTSKNWFHFLLKSPLLQLDKSLLEEIMQCRDRPPPHHQGQAVLLIFLSPLFYCGVLRTHNTAITLTWNDTWFYANNYILFRWWYWIHDTRGISKSSAAVCTVEGWKTRSNHAVSICVIKYYITGTLRDTSEMSASFSAVHLNSRGSRN